MVSRYQQGVKIGVGLPTEPVGAKEEMSSLDLDDGARLCRHVERLLSVPT